MILDVTKRRTLEKLEPKLLSEHPLNFLKCELSPTLYFQKLEGSAGNTGIWVALILKSRTGFKFYLSMAAAVFSASVPSKIIAGCTVPQSHDERGCGYFMAA